MSNEPFEPQPEPAHRDEQSLGQEWHRRAEDWRIVNATYSAFISVLIGGAATGGYFYAKRKHMKALPVGRG